MEIKIVKLTDNGILNKACSYTAGKEVSPSLNRMYKSEHSPIRTQIFIVEMIDIPTYCSVHFTRHKIGVEHFVKANRRTVEVVTRTTPVNHMMLINAQALINMARVRLCNKSDKITIQVMRMIKEEIEKIDPDLYEYLVPNCIYRKSCPELKPCGTINAPIKKEN
jgi:hypothetical protein